VCGCTPRADACLEDGYSCGFDQDGCGSLVLCGTCPAPQECGYGGNANQCGGCVPGECYPGAIIWCQPEYAMCTEADFFNMEATEECLPDGTWGPCNEGGTGATYQCAALQDGSFYGDCPNCN